ncbi:MAG TPA: hypothetical protein VM369_10675 [Candidatus Binatia bacterium]|nr:hypothetical protein [Candidatus Binatia bacterium]
MDYHESLSVPADHPCLAGHFPGNPVVPAVLLLERVRAALGTALGAPVELAALPAVKFTSPLAPGEVCELELRIDTAARSARFRLRSGARELVQGRLEYRVDGT